MARSHAVWSTLEHKAQYILAVAASKDHTDVIEMKYPGAEFWNQMTRETDQDFANSQETVVMTPTPLPPLPTEEPATAQTAATLEQPAATPEKEPTTTCTPPGKAEPPQ